MARIPEFTRTVLPDRSVGYARVAAARAPYDQKAEEFAAVGRGVRQVENAFADYRVREAQAENATAVNESVVQYKKDMADKMDALRQERNARPENFHKDFDTEMTKLADDYAKKLPSEAARVAFRDSAGGLRGSVYDDNLRWERTRKVEMFGDSVERTAETLSSLAYRAGQRGQSVADLYRDAEATAVAGSTFVAPEKVENIKRTMKENIAEAELQGLVEAQPEKAYREIKRGRFSGVQGSFDDSVAFVMEEEGGFVSDDGGKGPTLYGINSEANKEEYAQIKALFDQGKTDEAQALAQQTYKEKYWNAIGADKLDPKMALVAFDAAVNQGVGATKEMLAKAGGDVQRFIELRRERYQQTAKRPGKGQYLNGWLNRLDNLSQEINSHGLPPEKLLQYQNRAKSAVQVNIADDIDDVNTAAKLGVKVEEGKLEDLIRRTSSVGMKKEAQALREFAALQPEVTRFAAASLVQQRDELNTLKTSVEGGNLAEVKKYEAFSKVMQTKQEMINSGDALGFYAAHDIVREPQALDFQNQASMTAELDQRRVSAQQIKDLDGFQASLFTKQEIQMLKSIYESSDAKQTSALLASLGNALKPAEVTAIARAVAPTSSTLAVAMATSNPATAEKIFAGTKLKGDVKEADVRAGVNDLIGGVIVDPGKAEPMQESIYALYKQLSFMAGDTSDVLDESRLEKAVGEIMGPMADIDTKWGWGGTSKVLSYRDETTGEWKDEDALNDILSGITDEQLKEANGSLPVAPVGGVDAPRQRGMAGGFAAGKGLKLDEEKARKTGVYTAKMILNNSRFVSYGDGVYAAVIDGLGYLADEKGEVYQFDARKLEAIQRGKK